VRAENLAEIATIFHEFIEDLSAAKPVVESDLHKAANPI